MKLPPNTLDEASGSAAARELELRDKHARLNEWLERENYDGVLLRRHENLAWVSAGQVQARVAIPSETGVVALLVLRDGRRFAIAPNNEAARLEAEELPGLGYEVVAQPWQTLDVAAETRKLSGSKLAADAPLAEFPVVSLAGLRAPLLPAEIARYRVLGRQTADATSDALFEVEPGMNEYELEALVAGKLLRQGILPSVLLMAADQRILKYKHAVARGFQIERFVMLNLCARRWGLAVSITRFAYFGKLPQELEDGFATAARVNAELQYATGNGATAADLFRTAAETYAAAGYPGEEQLHHQGGACGYLEREWLATPSGKQTARTPEAFAWNPSCRGGKVEDTTLSIDGVTEVLTATPRLPQVITEVAGVPYMSSGVLLPG